MSQTISNEQMATVRQSLAQAGIYFDRLYINQVGVAVLVSMRNDYTALVPTGLLQQSFHSTNTGQDGDRYTSYLLAKAPLRIRFVGHRFLILSSLARFQWLENHRTVKARHYRLQL